MNTDSVSEAMISGVRPGFQTVTPYLQVACATELLAFVKEAFLAEELECHRDEGGRIQHAEIRIDGCMLELSDPGSIHPERFVALHLYVPDVDTVFQRAIAAGATSLMEPTDMPYGDREGDLQDAFGNQWYIATHQGKSHVRENLSAVTVAIRVPDVEKLIGFAKSVFGAEEIVRQGPYSQLRIGSSVVEPGQTEGKYGAITTALHCYVSDVDGVFERAVQAGAKALSVPEDKPYGERGAGIEDEFGNYWYLATWKSDSPQM